MDKNEILTKLPKHIKGANKGKIDWCKLNGMVIDIIYFGDIFKIKVNNYNKKTKKLTVEYNNVVNEINYNSFYNCNIGKIIGKHTNDFKIEIGTRFVDEKRDITIIDRKYIKDEKDWDLKVYKYKCNKCGFECGEHYRKGEYKEELWINEYSLLNQKQGCSVCSNQSTLENVNDIYTTDIWMVTEMGMSIEDSKKFSKCSHNKVDFICKYCGNINNKKISDVYSNKSNGCICGDNFSYPEKFMYSILTQLKVEFEIQYSPDYLIKNKSRKFSDFYLPEYKLIIETDGSLGHKNGTIHGNSNKTIEECVDIDNWKDEQHLKNGIKTIRINCFKSNLEYIKHNILKSELNNILDLKNIDWIKADLYAINSNQVKEICDYWNIKKYYETTSDLTNIFKISIGSIKSYLNKGTKLGWTNYNGNEEKKKSMLNCNKLKRKKVEVFDLNKNSLGIYESMSYIEHNSCELFGIKLLTSKISLVCNKKRKNYKGFVFKFI